MSALETVDLAGSAIDPPMTAGAKPLVLKSSQFRKAREETWRELEALVARAEKRGVLSLGPEELERLPILYRATLSSLSVARGIALDRNLLNYLEALSVRAYLVVYGPRVRQLRGIVRFLTADLPRAVRQARWHFLIAALTLLGGVIGGFLLAHSDEAWIGALVPAGLAGDRGPDSTADELRREEIFAPWPGLAQSFAIMANFLFSHNTLVGLLVFGLGIAAGIPGLLLLFYQGLGVGAFIALHYHRRLTIDFLGWLAVHGVTELTALTLFGAAGLLLAEKVLFPNRMTRIESVAMQGKVAAQIAIGAMIMLFVAGILEGGFRQLIQSTPWRFAIGGFTGLVWLSYFSLAGRRG
jgi:uncharacterized membrane protein SpoIIM required for sporulation